MSGYHCAVCNASHLGPEIETVVVGEGPEVRLKACMTGLRAMKKALEVV